MPELPEVHTTVTGIQTHVVGHRIKDVWSDYESPHFRGKDEIKDRRYFDYFKQMVIGTKIIGAERRAKNVLIHLSNGHTILVHMKMTGHLLYGTYTYSPPASHTLSATSPWIPLSPESLKDPFNRHIHLVFSLDHNKHVALSDSRKFAKVTLLNTKTLHTSNHLAHIGPEPLHKEVTYDVFKARMLLRPKRPIKINLMDQTLIAGIGNIYADESLWRAQIHPQSITGHIPPRALAQLYKSVQYTLSKGIDFGGDSMSDYRNILGERGAFQGAHMVYQRTGEACKKKNCNGTIQRIVVGGRGTHICLAHQIRY